MSQYSSFADYHRQRAASSGAAMKRRASTWFYEEKTEDRSDRSWKNYEDDELFDAEAYDGSKYSASASLGRYWGSYSSYGDSDKKKSKKQENSEKLARSLKAVARSCNAIRSTVGRGKDLSLKVKWSSGFDGNNVRQNDVIVLSPDTILQTKVKENWDEGKRSDALVGDALTAAAQKRTITPSVVAEAVLASQTDPDAETARLLWSAVETDVAQSALLNDYRGAAVYFAASNAFHSSDEYRTVVENSFTDGQTRKSDAATVALAWNILHQKKLELPEDVRELTATAMREFAKAKTCRDRWNASLRAVKLLRSLDPEQPPQENPPSPPEEESANQNPNGEGGDAEQDASEETSVVKNGAGQIGMSDLLGDLVENTTGPVQSNTQDVEEIAEEDESSLNSRNTIDDESRHTRLHDHQQLNGCRSAVVAPATKALLAGYNGLVRRLSGLADLFSTVNTVESYGRRSGVLDDAKLWSVPSGETNVFIRRDETGEKREVSIAVLVDLSGSTGCQIDTSFGGFADFRESVSFEERVKRLNKTDEDYPQHVPISVHLKRAASILTEALRASDTNTGVRIQTYGHYCGHVEYYGQTANLVQGDNGGGTDEAGALARTVKHFTESDTRDCRKIVICIGDGETDSAHLRKIVDASAKLGVEVYSILVAHHEGRIKQHGEVAFGKGRFCGLSIDTAKNLPTVLTSFVTRILSKAR
jgi:hypothetical protein